MKLYNTLTRRKEEFEPQGTPVRMYICGVTPYAECHVGHAMSYMIFDVLRRYLEWRGYEVLHVQNFTDVDDKIIQRASSTDADPKELTEGLIQEYFKDMDALNIQRANKYPRATEEIPKIIEMVSGLVEKGYAYAINGDVYFRVRQDDYYGKLSHRTLEGMMSGARVETDLRKEHPMDFSLWKAAKSGEPSWESPWGPGRPGWHMECSAMSLKYLGVTLDIHGGGQDLIFPHHENEIAQSEAFTGVSPFSKLWIHHGLLQLGEEKMSKSQGNLVTVKEVLCKHNPDALRLFVLSSYYRSPLTYSEDALSAMEKGAERLQNAIADDGQGQTGSISIDPDPFKEKFIEALEDDLGMAQAVAILYDLAREINRGKGEGADTRSAVETLKELSGVLGLTLRVADRIETLDAISLRGLLASLEEEIREADQPALIDAMRQSANDREDPALIIEVLTEARTELRKAKKWDLSDKIRSGLAGLGVLLEDTSQGTIWKLRRHSEEQ